MIITYNYYLEKLKRDILKDPTTEKFYTINPLLIAEFKKAITSITPQDWETICFLFQKNLKYLITVDEKMIYTILAAKMGRNFLDKNPEYIEELLSVLSILELSPLNYTYYASLFLSSPFYDTIIDIVDNNNIFCYFELIRVILSIPHSIPFNETDINYSLKILNNLRLKPYTILIDEDDTLYEIYKKIYIKMKEINEKKLIYNQKEFQKLEIILQILKENNFEKSQKLKTKILKIEKESYSIQSIIEKILELLERYQKIVTLKRRKKNGPC